MNYPATKDGWVLRFLNKNKYGRIRYNNDPEYKILCCLRRRVVAAILKEYKNTTSIILLCCDTKIIRDHLEKQFRDGMTWENHGKVWHIDHRIPCHFLI